jgi:hypothetical protein
MNHKVKLKFTQPFMLAQVDEVPAYSRIDAGLYITCLYCDRKVREVLRIKPDDVKVVGNIVGAASNPVHHSIFYANNNRNNNAGQQPRPSATTSSASSGNNNISRPSSSSGGQQTRGFGTNSGSNINGQQRSNWFGNDNDDHRPSGGGGAVSTSSGYSSGNSNGPQRSNWFGNDNDDHRPSGGGGAVSTSSGYGSGNSNGPQRSNWFNNSDTRPSGGGPIKPAYDQNRSLLNSYPDIKCKCTSNKKASKVVTKKDGPNKGRVFYTCDQCSLFHWADTPLPANLVPWNLVGGSGSGGGARKCSVCKNTGHNRKNCPALGN